MSLTGGEYVQFKDAAGGLLTYTGEGTGWKFKAGTPVKADQFTAGEEYPVQGIMIEGGDINPTTQVQETAKLIFQVDHLNNAFSLNTLTETLQPTAAKLADTIFLTDTTFVVFSMTSAAAPFIEIGDARDGNSELGWLAFDSGTSATVGTIPSLQVLTYTIGYEYQTTHLLGETGNTVSMDRLTFKANNVIRLLATFSTSIVDVTSSGEGGAIINLLSDGDSSVVMPADFGAAGGVGAMMTKLNDNVYYYDFHVAGGDGLVYIQMSSAESTDAVRSLLPAPTGEFADPAAVGWRGDTYGNIGGPWDYDQVRDVWVAVGSDLTGGFNNNGHDNLSSPEYKIIVGGVVTLSFEHRYSFEGGSGGASDAGQLWMSRNGGPYEDVGISAFTANGYTHVIVSAATGGGGYLDQNAFSGETAGHGDGTYITTTATLGTFFQDETVSVQFRALYDQYSSGANPNWEIARVSIIEPAFMLTSNLAPSNIPGGAFLVDNTGPSILSFPIMTGREGTEMSGYFNGTNNNLEIVQSLGETQDAIDAMLGGLIQLKLGGFNSSTSQFQSTTTFKERRITSNDVTAGQYTFIIPKLEVGTWLAERGLDSWAGGKFLARTRAWDITGLVADKWSPDSLSDLQAALITYDVTGPSPPTATDVVVVSKGGQVFWGQFNSTNTDLQWTLTVVNDVNLIGGTARLEALSPSAAPTGWELLDTLSITAMQCQKLTAGGLNYQPDGNLYSSDILLLIGKDPSLPTWLNESQFEYVDDLTTKTEEEKVQLGLEYAMLFFPDNNPVVEISYWGIFIRKGTNTSTTGTDSSAQVYIPDFVELSDVFINVPDTQDFSVTGLANVTNAIVTTSSDKFASFANQYVITAAGRAHKFRVVLHDVAGNPSIAGTPSQSEITYYPPVPVIPVVVIVSKGGDVVTGQFNSTNTDLKWTLTVPNDVTLIGGTARLEALSPSAAPTGWELLDTLSITAMQCHKLTVGGKNYLPNGTNYSSDILLLIGKDDKPIWLSSSSVFSRVPNLSDITEEEKVQLGLEHALQFFPVHNPVVEISYWGIFIRKGTNTSTTGDDSSAQIYIPNFVELSDVFSSVPETQDFSVTGLVNVTNAIVTTSADKFASFANQYVINGQPVQGIQFRVVLHDVAGNPPIAGTPSQSEIDYYPQAEVIPAVVIPAVVIPAVVLPRRRVLNVKINRKKPTITKEINTIANKIKKNTVNLTNKVTQFNNFAKFTKRLLGPENKQTRLAYGAIEKNRTTLQISINAINSALTSKFNVNNIGDYVNTIEIVTDEEVTNIKTTLKKTQQIMTTLIKSHNVTNLISSAESLMKDLVALNKNIKPDLDNKNPKSTITDQINLINLIVKGMTNDTVNLNKKVVAFNNFAIFTKSLLGQEKDESSREAYSTIVKNIKMLKTSIRAINSALNSEITGNNTGNNISAYVKKIETVTANQLLNIKNTFENIREIMTTLIKKYDVATAELIEELITKTETSSKLMIQTQTATPQT